MITHVTLPPAPTRTAACMALIGLFVMLSATAADAQGNAPRAQPAGTPKAQPAPAPAPAPAEAGADAAAETVDIEALRKEYLKLREELFRSRARAAAVASAMYSTRLRIDLRYESPRFYTVTRATIRLDGANVYDDTSGAVGPDSAATRFEGFVAPGRHVVSIRIEATAKDDERFATVIESTVTIQAPAGKDVVVHARARDSGDIAYEWQRKERGSYKLGLDIGVETQKRAEAARAAK